MIENKMGTKPIFPLVVGMSFPTILSMLINSMYNIVDSIFVAKIGGDALTAVSLAFPIQNLILAVAVGTGIGINSLIARKLGEKKLDEANIVVTHGIILSIISALIFIAFTLGFTDRFLRMFTESESILMLGNQYLYIIGTFSFGIIVHIAIEKVLQASGDMFYPMLFQAIGAIINIILDPIFIFGLFGFPALGVEGAALATVTGQISAMMLAVITLVARKKGVKARIKGFKFDTNIAKEIYKVGFPTILIQSLGSILVVCLNSLLISFSELAVSFMGIYFKLQTFVLMPVSGLQQGILPIIGYNYGAKNRDRVIGTVKVSLIIATSIMVLGTLIFILMPSQIIGMFDSSKEMLDMGVGALKIMSISYIPAAFGVIFTTFFQSVGKGGYSLAICLIRQIVIIIPLSYILSKFMGLNGIWITFIIAETLGAVISFVLFKQIRNTDEVLMTINENELELKSL